MTQGRQNVLFVVYFIKSRITTSTLQCRHVDLWLSVTVVIRISTDLTTRFYDIEQGCLGQRGEWMTSTCANVLPWPLRIAKERPGDFAGNSGSDKEQHGRKPGPQSATGPKTEKQN